jgi:hypothetical protein
MQDKNENGGMNDGVSSWNGFVMKNLRCENVS